MWKLLAAVAVALLAALGSCDGGGGGGGGGEVADVEVAELVGGLGGAELSELAGGRVVGVKRQPLARLWGGYGALGHGRCSHAHPPVYTSVILRAKHTGGRRGNDVAAHGQAPSRLCTSRWPRPAARSGR